MTVREILKLNPENQPCSIKAWVKTRRESKNIIFLSLSDGTCFDPIQAVFNVDELPEQAKNLQQATTGSAVNVSGILSPSPAQGQTMELQGSSISIIGDCPADTYPLQKKRHSFEFLREIAHLRPRTNTFGSLMRVRNTLSMAVHEFFQQRGFFYVHTPIITGVDAEGAGAMFQVTTLDINNAPKNADGFVDYSRDFFQKPSYLAVTGQLEGETYACAMRNIYTFGPTFRAENSNTSRHLAEFWMIEPEMAFCDIGMNMDVAEDFLKHIFQSVLDKNPREMQFFDSFVQKGIIENLESVIKSSFTRIDYSEAIKLLSESGREFDFPVSWGMDLQSEHEKFLTEDIFKGPVIVTDYPKEIKAFYMKLNEDEKTVRAMDVLVPRLGEIIGGSERENSLQRLQNRMMELKMKTEEYWWYTELRKYGSVPHSGFGLGFERVLQYISGMGNIRDVIPYHRTVGSADF